MQEVWHRADDARQPAPDTAIIATMLRVLALSVLIAATPIPSPAGAADGHDSGRVAWVTDGDTFRLESGERIRIAGIDARKRIATRPNARAKQYWDCGQRTAPRRCSRGAT